MGFLALGFVLCLPAAMAKAENSNQANANENRNNTNENRGNVNGNQANANENRDNTNEDRGNVNEDKTNLNEDKNDVNDNQGNVNQGQSDAKQFNGAEHQSAVATFVQSLLNVADREKDGIGQQVKTIAQAQNDAVNQAAEAINKIKNRNKIKTFLIGTDYKNIGMLRSGIVTTENQISQLNTMLSKTTSTSTEAVLQTQIQTLTQEQQKIQDFIKANESKFSLFGWLVKLLNP